jgi:hypothetical protein
MDYHHIINNKANLPLPNEYMNVLRNHDRDSYDSPRRHEPINTFYINVNLFIIILFWCLFIFILNTNF